MVTIEKTYHQCAAYWPRSGNLSTVDYRDTLESCFCIWNNKQAVRDSFNVVLVHGSQCSKEIWNFHVELLFKHFGNSLAKCVGVDIVTHGDAALINHDKLGIYAGWSDVSRDVGLVLHECRRQHGLDGPIIYIGHSMGGAVGLTLGCQEPGLLAGIIALDPILRNAGLETIGPMIKLNLDLVKYVISTSKDTFATREEAELWYNTFFCKRWDQRVTKPFVAANFYQHPDSTIRSKANTANQVSAYLSFDHVLNFSTSGLRELEVPTRVLYAVGRNGRPTPSHSEFLRDIIEDVEITELEGGHNFPFETPEQVMHMLYPFIESKVADAWARQWHHHPVRGDAATKFQFRQLNTILEQRHTMRERHGDDAKYPRTKL